ncbi:N-acetylmuramoyl-L-alanine amidase [Streptomyces sp. NPDC088915]|uniref:N-acetylmuramoyl-L-alanine amidase n=1 Tax=Streptomyces sp. NPDC088915 TaxID=3365912 RepID=UPI003806F26F
MSRRHRRDRKRKRLFYGAAAAVAATVTIGGLAVASPGLLDAAGEGGPGRDATLQEQFASAAREFDVPQSVLMAVSYQQTRWESHDGEPSTTGAYNVMGLTKVEPEDVAQKVTDEQIDHFDGSGRPEIAKKFDREQVRRILEKALVDTDDPRLHTLDKAAELIDSSAETVRNDTGASVRAGAALLADYQKQAGAELSEEPGDWYPAVARYSQSPEKKGADLFAKRVFESIKEGERAVTLDGEQVALPADPSADPVKPANVPLAASFASTATVPTPECPAGLNCVFVPVRTDPGGSRNYTPGDRPNQGMDIRQIVIHDTEGPYQGSLDVLTDPKGIGSAHYLIRAQDGQVTQMLENKQLAWHAGNWTHNMHTIGVEHEGFAIKEGSWYTEPQYRSSAELVKFLAKKYGVPIDREHIIGHDEVALQTDAGLKDLHWDAGPYWDWNYYMSLLGAPQGDKGAGGLLRAEQVVRVVPPFTTANQPKLTHEDEATKEILDASPRPSNFVYLHTEPSTASATLTDPYFSSLWTLGSNYGNKVRAGGLYVVAETRGDWTAVWYAGQKAWFQNPGGQYTVPVSGATTVKVAAGLSSATVYGRAFPETAAYTAAGLQPPANDGAYLTKFTFAPGQAYVKAGPAVKGDEWFGSAQKNVIGSTLYVPIRFHHKIVWVKQSEVTEAPGAAPVAADNRYNLLARDASGVLWQYQGTGTGGATAFLARYRVGAGWNAYDALTAMTALRADGTGDAVAREPSGTLWYYQGTGNPSAPFRARLRTGGGWQVYDRILGVRDLDGDGRADLIAREKAGTLWYYQGTGNPAAPFKARLKVGGGWQTYNEMISTGDLSGDGRPDLVARDAAGVLWYYQGTGKPTAPFAARVQVGGGWQTYNGMVGPSDLDGDGRGDLVGRDAKGLLWFYKSTGKPTAPFAARVQVSPGWQIYNLIF